jgi:hypothetical protein
MLAEWTYVETDASEGYCHLQYFGIKKQHVGGDVEFVITLREYINLPTRR